jgi:hypothetical protein
MIEPAPVEVHSIMFRPDGYVELTYAERYELSEFVSVVKTIVIEKSKFKEELDDLQLAAFELIDEALLVLTNPPDREPLK